MTFQVTYGVRWGANQANRRVGGGGGTRRSVSRVQHQDPVIGLCRHCAPFWATSNFVPNSEA